MPKIKLTKTAVDAATPQERDYELRDTTIPGFLVKVTPTGRKIFMVAYVAHRRPDVGRCRRYPLSVAAVNNLRCVFNTR